MTKTLEEQDIMNAAMISASDLIQMHNSGLTISAKRTRMIRIANDLMIAAKINENWDSNY